MKEKNKEKKMRNKDFRAKKDMEKILSDSRFAHVPFDPKLRHQPKEERKVKLDSRFTSMFSDDKFYEKSTMDPRGRKGNYSTKEDLRKFYDMSSDEDESSDDEDNEEEFEDLEERDEEEGEEEEEEKENKKNDTVENDDNEDAFKENKEEQKEREEISHEILERLQDMTQDYARGALLFSDDSSDDDSSSEEEEEEEEFDWGELDQDAVWDTEQEIEETSRIAVCNLDWNHVKAVDIMVVFHSFCPRGGSVNKVTIYPSEFGKQRMAEEDQFGPRELTTDTANGSYDKEVNLERLEKGKLDYRSGGSKGNYEALRRYERNRLRYYYAVVECDTIDTAKVLYKECDRQSFERAGVLMDLRYIPADMTFDETPHNVCVTVPEFYEAKLFTTTALFDSQPTLTWDQTDPHRQKVLSNAMKNAMCGNEINEEYLKNFIASSSEDEDSPAEEEEDFSSDEGEDTKTARIAKFRALIQEIDEKEKKRKAGRFDMEEVFGIEETEQDEKDVSEEDKDNKKDLNPFEKYLEKRKTKRKNRIKGKKMEASKEDNSSDEESDSNAEFSDDAIPDGVGDIYNDPFFAEELKNRQKHGSKEKKKKKQTKKEETNDIPQGDLELLLMEEDKEEKKHFSMREIIDDHKGKSKKKLKKKVKQKMKEKMKEKASYVEDFKVDIKDPRFSTLLTSGEYNIDPSHPQFKRTKAMDNLINDVQKKRIADSFESTPDPKRINLNKGREDHELSLLVKRVKSKTKKPKKS